MRQPLLFVMVGGLQYLLDATLFGLLMAAGVPTAPGNVAARVSAAVVGFVLNRYVTFDKRGGSWRVVGASLGRFVALFIGLTALSTLSLLALESVLGDSLGNKLGYKLSTEAVLAVISFFLSRHWVYRS